MLKIKLADWFWLKKSSKKKKKQWGECFFLFSVTRWHALMKIDPVCVLYIHFSFPQNGFLLRFVSSFQYQVLSFIFSCLGEEKRNKNKNFPRPPSGSAVKGTTKASKTRKLAFLSFFRIAIRCRENPFGSFGCKEMPQLCGIKFEHYWFRYWLCGTDGFRRKFWAADAHAQCAPVESQTPLCARAELFWKAEKHSLSQKRTKKSPVCARIYV